MSKENENNDVIEHSMSKSETRSMPMKNVDKPEDYQDLFTKIKNKQNK